MQTEAPGQALRDELAGILGCTPDELQPRDTRRCYMCHQPTTSTVRGRDGGGPDALEGFMCEDCQHHCDGNVIRG